MVRDLFAAYQRELGVDLCFQGFEGELASLPEPYDEPAGSLYLAWENDLPIGCVAFKPLGDRVCELKRLYVRPESRRTGAGRRLTEVAIDDARRKGYRTMRLDTLERLQSALRLYHELGFVEIEPYYDNPLAEKVIYMELPLME